MFRSIFKRFSSQPELAKLPLRLQDKVAVITGSTKGIGFAIAKRFVEEGARVMISSRSQENVENAVERLRKEGYPVEGKVCHVCNAEDRQNLLQATKDAFGGIDILVSNAGVNPFQGPVLDTPDDKWREALDVNIKAPYFITKEAIPFLKESGGGSVILISHIGGFLPDDHSGVMCLSKSSLLGLSKAFAPFFSPMGIRVNCIAPGIIKTESTQTVIDDQEALRKSLKGSMMLRPGEAEEVAATAAYLASDDASYVTGENHVVAGGRGSRL